MPKKQPSKTDNQSALLGLLADIRAAVGDPTGKLMQDELVERCRKLYADNELLRAARSCPARIVLGSGYPWAMGPGPEYHQIALGKSPVGFSPRKLKWPRKLWAKDLPKYRLVLELIETPNAIAVAPPTQDSTETNQ
jgi:hypothetical protein